MNGIYTIGSSSVSSLYGNINCAIRELIISRFPKDFFKYTTCSTEFAYHNMRRQFGGNNSKKEINKRRRPQLIIQPIFQEPDKDSFMQEIPLTKNIHDLQYRVDGRYLMDIIRDEKYGYQLAYKLNRDRIEYDVKISVSTLHQQLDCYKAMMNQITWEIPMSRMTALEAVIPKSIIYRIGQICRIDVEKDENLIPILLGRMNETSMYPITYKLRNASATDEYFMYYMHRVIITFMDLSIDEGNKKNMVDDSYELRFKVRAEFNLPGMYMLSGNIQRLDDLKVGIQAYNSSLLNEPSGSDYIPLFTIDNFYTKYPPEWDGMRLLGSSRFICEKKTNISPDELDISAIFSLDQRKAIAAYTSYNMQPHTLVRIIVIRNNEELVEGVDYTMDWTSCNLTILQPDIDATYRFVVYNNLQIMNEILGNAIESRSAEKSQVNPNVIHKEDQRPVQLIK